MGVVAFSLRSHYEYCWDKENAITLRGSEGAVEANIVKRADGGACVLCLVFWCSVQIPKG